MRLGCHTITCVSATARFGAVQQPVLRHHRLSLGGGHGPISPTPSSSRWQIPSESGRSERPSGSKHSVERFASHSTQVTRASERCEKPTPPTCFDTISRDDEQFTLNWVARNAINRHSTATSPSAP
jgi:hypothetical protein